MNTTNQAPNLNNWLSAVRTQIDELRTERQVLERPKRNRARERARQEARRLFRDYYAETAISLH